MEPLTLCNTLPSILWDQECVHNVVTEEPSGLPKHFYYRSNTERIFLSSKMAPRAQLSNLYLISGLATIGGMIQGYCYLIRIVLRIMEV